MEEDDPGKATVYKAPRHCPGHILFQLEAAEAIEKERVVGKGWNGAFRSYDRASEFSPRSGQLCRGDLAHEFYNPDCVTSHRNQFQLTLAKRRIYQEDMMKLAELKGKLTNQASENAGTRTSRRKLW